MSNEVKIWQEVLYLKAKEPTTQFGLVAVELWVKWLKFIILKQLVFPSSVKIKYAETTWMHILDSNSLLWEKIFTGVVSSTTEFAKHWYIGLWHDFTST